MLNRTTRALGSKQEPVLMNLMLDLYAANGFYADMPSSWDINTEIRKGVMTMKTILLTLASP